MKEVGFIHFRLRRHPALGRSSPRVYASPASFMLLVSVSPFEKAPASGALLRGCLPLVNYMHVVARQRCLDLLGGLLRFAARDVGPDLHLRNGFDSSARAQVHPRRAQRLDPGTGRVDRRKGILSGLGFVFIADTTSLMFLAPMSLATMMSFTATPA